MTDPAKISYMFTLAPMEYSDSVKEIFEDYINVIKKNFGKLENKFIDLTRLDFSGNFFNSLKFGSLFSLQLGFFFGELLLHAVLSALFGGLFILLYGAAVYGMKLYGYVTMGILLSIEYLFSFFKRIAFSCPNCQAKHKMPTYLCKCGRKHKKLMPSSAGLLKRECVCGQKLACSLFSGRHRLSGRWLCPDCDYEIGGPLHTDIPIPVVAGPNAGKTCFIISAIMELEKNSERKHDLLFEYHENPQLGDDYYDNKRQIERGNAPLKTRDSRLRYYQFYLTPRGKKIRNMVSLCDVAGEVFAHGDDVIQPGFKNAAAYLIIVDPLSIPALRADLDPAVVARTRFSTRPMDEVVNILIKTLELFGVKESQHAHIDIAVVFTKCDTPGIDDIIGNRAVMRTMQTSGIESRLEAQNAVCQSALMKYGEANFLNAIRSQFRSLQFFTTSALGESGQAFNPIGVDEPILWLVDKVSPDINLKAKWGKKI